MRILYLANHLNIGGISSYIYTLAGGLQKQGHRIYVASSGGELLGQFTQAGITFIPLPLKTKSEASPKIWLSLFSLGRYLKSEQIDILHANTRVTQVLAFLVSRIFHKPYVSTCHGFFKRRVFRRLFPLWGRKVIAISEPVKQHLMEDFAVRAEDIRVIHNGVDVSRFQVWTKEERARKKKMLGLSEGIVVGIIARLSDVKGHIYLFQAMPEVLRRFPETRLMLVGEGRMKDELVALGRELGISQNVSFFDSVSDTAGMLCAMDIFVLPSLKEGLGLSLMEAMASGLAVIGSRIGGIRSLISEGENGLLVSPGEAGELTQAILKLIADGKMRRALGDNARAFIEKNFPEEKMLRDTERVYQECLNAAG